MSRRVETQYYCAYCDKMRDTFICPKCEHKGHPFRVDETTQPKETDQ